VDFYRGEGNLKSVDGMAEISEVTRQIGKLLEGVQG